MAKTKKAMFDAYQEANTAKRIRLVNLQGKYIRETKDAICFEVNIKGLANARAEWFPLNTVWYKDGAIEFQCHKHIADKKGLVYD